MWWMCRDPKIYLEIFELAIVLLGKTLRFLQAVRQLVLELTPPENEPLLKSLHGVLAAPVGLDSRATSIRSMSK